MAIQCSHCGKMLPGEDARFCMSCGTLVPSHPMSPQSLSAPENTSVPPANAPSNPSVQQQKPVLREQIAHQPASRSAQSSAQDSPPPWLSQLDRRDYRKALPDDPAKQVEKPLRQELPPEMPPPQRESSEPAQTWQHVPEVSEQKPAVPWHEFLPYIPMAGPANAENADRPAQKDSAEPIVPLPQSEAGRGKFRREAWIHEDTQMLNSSEKPPATNENTIDELPTRPISTPLPQPPRAQESIPPPLPEDTATEVEHLETRPMQITPLPPTALPPEVLQERLSQPGLTHNPEQLNTNQAAHQRPSMISMPGLSNPGLDPNFGQIAVPGASQPPSPIQQGPLSHTPPPPSVPRPQRRLPLLIALILLCVLVIGGLASWVITAQPFSVSPVTQAWKTFTDPKLGFSLLYPNNGWSVNVDHAKSTAQLYDSTRTAQVNVTVAQANNADLPQYLSAQAKQLAMTGAKPGSPQTFGGSTWQQIQGTIQQDGASYTSTVLVTTHNNRLYTLTLLAPNYPEQEEVNFAPMRASWKFL